FRRVLFRSKPSKNKKLLFIVFTVVWYLLSIAVVSFKLIPRNVDVTRWRKGGNSYTEFDQWGLERITDCDIQHKIVASPSRTFECYVVDHPRIIREPGFPEWKGKIESQDEEVEVHTKAKACTDSKLLEKLIPMKCPTRSGFVRSHEPDISGICEYRSLE